MASPNILGLKEPMALQDGVFKLHILIDDVSRETAK
jgi:hypothetical protein